jgi:hypothetical protein
MVLGRQDGAKARERRLDLVRGRDEIPSRMHYGFRATRLSRASNGRLGRRARRATFVLMRAIVAHRFGGTDAREFYFEPYTMGSILEPDAGGVVGDLPVESAR